MLTTTISLPDDLIRDIDRADRDRSAFLERAARRYLADLASAERCGRDAADKVLYERHADRLNAEAADVLVFQSQRKAPHHRGESVYTMTTDLAGSLAGKRLPATNARSKFRRP